MPDVDEMPVLEMVDVFCYTEGCVNQALALANQGLDPYIRIERVLEGRVVCGGCGREVTDVRAVA